MALRTWERLAFHCLTILVVAGFGVPVVGAQKDEKKIPYLVWPLPPDKPRIRYLGEIHDNFDIEPRKSRSFLQKLIGAPDPNLTRALRKPAGVATDSRGRIYVADSGRGFVFVFDEENREVSYLGVGGAGIPMKVPLDVVVDSADRVYVADAGMKSVMVYDPDGTLINVIANQERLVNPSGLALDEARGRLYVVDSQGHHVLVLAWPTLEIQGQVSERGEKPGKLNFPVAVAVDKEGRIYVTDTGSCSVQIFGPDYEYIASFGGRGIAPSQFTRPKQISLDREGNIYVVDAAFNNFQIFSPDHKLLLFVGVHGSQPGQFNLPFGIHIDKQDHVYVTDQLNGRVQKFQFLGGR